MSPSSPSGSPTGPDDWRPLSDAEADTFLDTLCGYFGVARGVFAHHRFWTRPSGGSLWVAHRDVASTPFGRPQAYGIRVHRAKKASTEVSNAFMRRFLASATAHVVTIEETEVDAFFTGSPRPTQGQNGVYVVRASVGVLGRGRIIDDVLHAELSKNERGALA